MQFDFVKWVWSEVPDVAQSPRAPLNGRSVFSLPRVEDPVKWAWFFSRGCGPSLVAQSPGAPSNGPWNRGCGPRVEVAQG